MRPVTYGDVLRQGEAFLAGAGIPEHGQELFFSAPCGFGGHGEKNGIS